MWEVPDGAGSVLRYDVSYEHECYTLDTYDAPATQSDPVELLRFYVSLLDKADRVLRPEAFEGKDCVGFEVSASKYGDNPEHWMDRIWFDVDSGLPVRIELHGRPVTNHPEQTFTFVKDQFEYWVEVPVAKFEPQIPEGFVNTHPDNVRAAKELQEKGEMIFADVPEGVKDSLIAALDAVRTVSYRESGDTRFYLSRHGWRKDGFEGDRLRRAEWFVIEKDDTSPTSLDFNDKNFRLVHTVVDYDARTYEQTTHGADTRPGHPMDRIRFLVGCVDRADRILQNTVIEGIECFGFEISAKKYGSNPDGMIHRVWFDTATNLPVKMEFESPRDDGATPRVKVRNRFIWNPEFSADHFVPDIPPGFGPAETDGS
jgi:outer membrane lipoprotein-sorting protein